MLVITVDDTPIPPFRYTGHDVYLLVVERVKVPMDAGAGPAAVPDVASYFIFLDLIKCELLLTFGHI
jgi:hypothetical protein